MDAKQIVGTAAMKRLRWRCHPEEFVRDVLRIEQIDRDFKITSQQIDALKAIGRLYMAKYKQFEVDKGRKPEDDKNYHWKPMTEDNTELANMI